MPLRLFLVSSWKNAANTSGGDVNNVVDDVGVLYSVGNITCSGSSSANSWVTRRIVGDVQVPASAGR